MNTLETMYPLLPLTPLPAHIKQLERHTINLKLGLRNTRCLDTRSQYILIGGNVVWRKHSFDRIEKVGCGIVQLEFS